MPAARVPNQIRKYRKRACLTQADVAFILGSKSSAAISRHERFKQTPDLHTLLAYEMLFRTPVRNLFSGTHETIEQKLLDRIRLLILKLRKAGQRPGIKRRIEVLTQFMQERDAVAGLSARLQQT